MFLRKVNFNWSRLPKLHFLALLAMLFVPKTSFAGEGWAIVDKLDLSPFIPNVLDAFLTVASGVYEYFVGNGDGIIYLLIWGFLAISIFLYLAAMYFPKNWAKFFGMSGGGEMWDGKLKAGDIVNKVLKTAIRAIVAATVLLQIKPNIMTEWLINPFLEFGAIYTRVITETANENGPRGEVKCPPSIIQQEWLSERSCDFLVQPVADLSATNNKMIKRGFQFLSRGLHGLMIPIPNGGQDFLNVLTGISIIFAFVGCNLFMALLIIQGIFNFGMALILYPFHVLSWVAKNSDKWLDVWPPFEGVIKALKQLVITMIACGFILLINIAVVKSLFNWSPSTFVVAAGGSTSSNVPTAEISAIDFGGHSMVWLSAILTFFLMISIFNLTRKQLELYAPGQSGLYEQVKSDAKTSFGTVKSAYSSIKNAMGLVKKIKKK